MELSNLKDAEFKTLVIKKLNKLMWTVDEFSENFNRDKRHKNGNGNYKREPVTDEEYIILDEEDIRGNKQSE